MSGITQCSTLLSGKGVLTHTLEMMEQELLRREAFIQDCQLLLIWHELRLARWNESAIEL
jgi:hypothetical protein